MRLFGNYLRCLRVKKGLSQENMAYELKISVTAYSKIERGLTGISLERLNQVAKCLEMSMTSIIEFYEREEGTVFQKKSQEQSNYVNASEYNESTILFMETRILELEESLRLLAKTVESLKNIIQELFFNKILKCP
jgi:transcriptional regulator with XRE-family HTH domain